MSDQPQMPTPQKQHHYGLFFTVLFIAFGALGAWGITSRIMAAEDLKQHTGEMAIANVTVLQAQNGPDSDEVVLPGNIEAWHEAPIYARTTGYLKEWKTDIGAQVKAGDVLAEIDTPEIDAQYHQAQADVATAIANNNLAQTTYKRWEALLKTNSVSKQETDEKAGDAAAKAAMVASAQAHLDHLQQLEDFKHVVAPFDGVITARNIDNGALVNGANGASQELFHIADMSKLRIYTQIPENYALNIKQGLTADLNLPAFPNRSFPATLETTADAIDPVTRTLLAQFIVDNAGGELKSGGYAEVRMHVPVTNANIHLPINTLLFRDGSQVATINADNKIVLKNIVIGRDYGKEIEVVSGIEAGDKIVINPPDSIQNGQSVHVVTPQPKPEPAAKNGTGK